MIGTGIKASELIAALEKLKTKHGDQMVWVSSGDYPGGCSGVVRQKEGEAYIPKGVFVVYGGD